MPLTAVIGQGKAPDGREAGAQAALRAIEQVGRAPIVFGILIASHNHPFDQVISGATALLGDIPLIGFTTSAEIFSGEVQQRSVAIALIAGTEVSAQVDFWSGFGEDSRGVSLKMAHELQPRQDRGTLFIIADGFHGDPKDLCTALPSGSYTLAGCLAGGELRQARTYQLGGRQSGHGGLAAAYLDGKMATGVGMAHGWQDIGVYFQVTRVRGPWIRTLNKLPAAEIYARWLGYEAREWSFPPLNEIVRLYPLGIEKGNSENLLVRSPLRMESDGSLRMHTVLSEGEIAHLLVGNTASCLKSAEEAASQALKSLGEARPILGIVLPDISWRMFLETQPGAEIAVVRKTLGAHIPIIGGYTFGQIANLNQAPEFHNQQIQVIILGEAIE